MRRNTIFLSIIITIIFTILHSQEADINQNNKAKWYNWALNKIIIKETEASNHDETSRYFSYDYFAQYEGLKIRSISINKFDIFSNPQDSTNLTIQKRFLQAANYLHINTQNFIIQNNILFKVGDEIDAYYFAESERILRRNNFIYEVAIIVIPDSFNEFADVYIYTKDVWSIRVKFKYNTANDSGNLELSDINFLGTGSKLLLDIKKKPEYKRNYKLDAEYNFEKLFDKFGHGAVYYYSETDIIHYGFGANQFFIQPWIRWLGGINFNWVRYRTNIIENDTLSFKVPIHYRQQDLWAAYTFSSKEVSSLPGTFNHYILSNRLILTKYTDYPDDYYQYFKENMFYLANFTFLRRSFYQNSYIFAFGKIEDIPVGLKIDLLAGSELKKIENKQYYGLSILISDYNEIFGYNLYNLRLGSYHSSEGWENGLLDFQSLSFSDLKYFFKIKYRNFYSFRMSQSLHPIKKEDLITINDKDGLRGFDAKYYGSKRISFSIENDAFLPFSIFGFKTAFITFADHALLANKNQYITKQPLQQGYGFSLRFKNEQLVFSTLQLTFAYYPKGTYHNVSDFRFYSEYDTFYQFNKMNYKKPEIFKW